MAGDKCILSYCHRPADKDSILCKEHRKKAKRQAWRLEKEYRELMRNDPTTLDTKARKQQP